MTTITAPETEFKQQGILLGILAVVFFSTSPVLVRWAAPLSPYEITFWRIFVAAFSVGLITLFQKKLPRLDRRNIPRFMLFGFITALHFLSFIASLTFTTIAHALTIVYTAPVFVALCSKLFLQEPISHRKWGGIALVIIGVAVLAGFEPEMTPVMLLGDGLALISAITYGFYSVMGRSQRQAYPLLTYTFFIYSLGALWVAPVAIIYATPTGYGLQQILSLIALGIFPLGLGHTLYNAALRHMNATYVNLIATQEITGGILLGIIFLSEFPGLNDLVGIAITLVGIVIVLI